MIKQLLEAYQPKTQQEAEQSLREILQEIALLGLQRTGFFEKAAFYGGTALRLFYGLDRFSEDLDFSLLETDKNLSLEPYLNGIVTECNAMGLQVSVREKVKSNQTNIDSAFLTTETIWQEIILDDIIPQANLNMRPSIKIKIEVDTAPPLGFEVEEKLLLKPISFYVKCFKLPDLFAGKMHALIFRKWTTRVKGRDWFDMEWYIKKGIPLNLGQFLQRAQKSGDWTDATISKDQFKNLLNMKISETPMNRIREDIVRFIRDDSMIAIWSEAYFKTLVTEMKF